MDVLAMRNVIAHGALLLQHCISVYSMHLAIKTARVMLCCSCIAAHVSAYSTSCQSQYHMRRMTLLKTSLWIEVSHNNFHHSQYSHADSYTDLSVQA